ncbi:hypothetical protein [Amycolatopsis coloradensis]|uniref:hypothetical protein n=1 Tax=Amycolatopsis coloradensis TaxID=76021 RepID=UPI001FC9B9DC|nr:hypothetical protein [Amycolatopsis coloradensis]
MIDTFFAWMIPHRQPVVAPYLHTEAPTGASADPVIVTRLSVGGIEPTNRQSVVLVTRMTIAPFGGNCAAVTTPTTRPALRTVSPGLPQAELAIK